MRNNYVRNFLKFLMINSCATNDKSGVSNEKSPYRLLVEIPTRFYSDGLRWKIYVPNRKICENHQLQSFFRFARGNRQRGVSIRIFTVMMVMNGHAVAENVRSLRTGISLRWCREKGDFGMYMRIFLISQNQNVLCFHMFPKHFRKTLETPEVCQNNILDSRKNLRTKHIMVIPGTFQAYV